jgi:hypothetical protein
MGPLALLLAATPLDGRVAISRQMFQEILRLIAEQRPRPPPDIGMRPPLVMGPKAPDGRTTPRYAEPDAGPTSDLSPDLLRRMADQMERGRAKNSA